jgi:hypothetical protein
MDTIITGKKGSGKTYYAVNLIHDLKDRTKVLHNIKGFELGKNIFDLAKEWGIKPIDFFLDSFHDEDSPRHDPRFKELHGYLYVIDECQKLFPKSFKNQDVDQFFQMSRHYDIDTILITQFEKLVSPSITGHCELTYNAVSDTANPLPGFFLYNKMVGWEAVGLPLKIRKKQSVFDLYKSADTENGGKGTRKKARPMVVLAVCAVCCGIAALLYFKYYTSHRSEIRGNSISSVGQKAAVGIDNGLSSRFGKQEKNTSSPSNTYPSTLSDMIGGIMVPVSIISDRTGRYVIFLDVPYNINLFPYRIVTNPFGEFTIIPPEVYEYYKQVQQEKMIAVTEDPNSPYYWTEQTTTNPLTPIK